MFLVSSNDNLPVKSARERGYDVGYGRGTIDRCSGKPDRNLCGIEETDYNGGYTEGYCDGYCSNDPGM